MFQPLRQRRVHKKSKFGCWTCKQRKIKCDETRPVCANCLKYSVDVDRCIYDLLPLNDVQSRKPLRWRLISQRELNPKRVSDLNDYPDIFEVRLIENYTVTMSALLEQGRTLHPSKESYMWRQYFPQQAHNNKLVLYTMLARSALHLRTFSHYVFPDSKSVPELFLAKALNAHRVALAEAHRDQASAEAVAASGLLMMHYTWCCFNHSDQTKEVFQLPLQIWYLAYSLDNLFNTLDSVLCNTTRQFLVRYIPATAADNTFRGNPLLESGKGDLAGFLKDVEADPTIPKNDIQVYEHAVDTIMKLYTALDSTTDFPNATLGATSVLGVAESKESTRVGSACEGLVSSQIRRRVVVEWRSQFQEHGEAQHSGD